MHQRHTEDNGNTRSAHIERALILLEDQVQHMVGKSLHAIGLPTPQRDNANQVTTSELMRETNYNQEHLHTYIEQNEPLLIPDQRLAYKTIIDIVSSHAGGIVFLDAPGGTGKTFLINLLLAKIRRDSHVALAVASSGIAATLLCGGRTAHSLFKLPLSFTQDEAPFCNISKRSGLADLLRQCKMIVWDECTMAHRQALEALDRTLQDLRGNSTIMGGVALILAGDFRQTLPVIPRGTMADELDACLKSSRLWRHVTRLSLKTNMRIHLTGAATDNNHFSNHLLDIGDGKIPFDNNNDITLPQGFCNYAASQTELAQKVFPQLSQRYPDINWLSERAILAPRNETVRSLNFTIQQSIPGPEITYTSIDTVVDEQDAVHYPTEFLNSLQPSGMPSHKLILKVGSPIMLLRNLSPPKLCNGTRLVVKTLMPHVIEATIMSGSGQGEDVFIPRIPLIPSDLPFRFRRLQFPVVLAFAISINKAQGQSLKIAGIDLTSPCFSHGQLYVACSRVGNGANLFIYPDTMKTKNIVHQAALQ